MLASPLQHVKEMQKRRAKAETENYSSTGEMQVVEDILFILPADAKPRGGKGSAEGPGSSVAP